jgi:hypothetical protein
MDGKWIRMLGASLHSLPVKGAQMLLDTQAWISRSGGP